MQTEPTQDRLQALWDEAAAIWDCRASEAAFAGYVSADYAAIYQSLVSLRSHCDTFLEWGSGLGVVAIMASQLGFQAFGIEVEPELVEVANRLAECHHVAPTFGIGSFIPDEFQAILDQGDEFHRTEESAPDAYQSIDMQLRDFDLVYAYPWPEEHGVFQKIIRKCGAPHAFYLSYDAREGLSLTQPGKRKRRK